MGNLRRMNVALTRANYGRVIVSSRDMGEGNQANWVSVVEEHADLGTLIDLDVTQSVAGWDQRFEAWEAQTWRRQ